jgi:hypothetical protein
MNQNHPDKRTLAIDLSSRGFAYAIFDGGELADWGIRRISGNKNAACLDGVRNLVHWYLPEVIVLERYDASASRRSARIKALANRIVRLAESLEISSVRIPWSMVQEAVGQSPKATKEQIAARIAELFPKIRRQAPPKRKPWMSEDERMNLFDAVALGTATLASGARA